VKTLSLSGRPPLRFSTHWSSTETALVALGAGVLALVACVALPLVLALALFLTAFSTGAFAVARAVARRCDEAEPFVHGPTILPPAV